MTYKEAPEIPPGAVKIYGASDDLVEFDGAIYGEAGVNYSTGKAKVTLKAPDGAKMRLLVEFCGEANPDGWKIHVSENLGGWTWSEFQSHADEPDFGVVVVVPSGTKAKCDGEPVH